MSLARVGERPEGNLGTQELRKWVICVLFWDLFSSPTWMEGAAGRERLRRRPGGGKGKGLLAQNEFSKSQLRNLEFKLRAGMS